MLKEEQEKIYELLDSEITPQTEKELSQLLIPYSKGSIGIAQINPIVGNLEYNAKKIVKYIKHAQNIGIKIVIFPELTLTGAPLEDTIDKNPFLIQENIKWLNAIAQITEKTVAIVGFVEPVQDKSLSITTPQQYLAKEKFNT